VLRYIYGDDGTGFQVLPGTGDSLKDNSSNRGWKNVLCSNLQDAWAAPFARREEHPEIEIVGENHKSVRSRVVENLRVWGRWRTDGGPVSRFNSTLDKKPDLEWAQIHVDQDLHVTGRGSSISSTRQAAYANA
jgi:hypothetical protein